MAYKRKIFSLPNSGNPSFESKVKEIIETREGVRALEEDAFVTFGELIQGVDLGNSYSHGNYVATGKPVIGDGTPPNAPTNISVESRFFGNYITWTNPTDADLSCVEVWMATTQSRSAAVRIAIVTKPINHFFHSMPSLSKTDNHYYWLRAVDYSGLYSEWEPNDDQGGYLASGDPSLEEQISNFIDAMKYEMEESTFRTNANGHITGFGHIYVGDAENNVVAILCDKFEIVNPSNSGDLKYPFIVGTVNGISTVGIDGNLVVDGSITAISLDVSQLSAITANCGTLTAGLIESPDWGATGGMQFDLSNGTVTFGGSTDPRLTWNGTTLAIEGEVTVTGGSGVTNYSDFPNPLANLLRNPGFEDSTSPDWWHKKTSSVSIETTGGNNSNYWMKITRSGSDVASYAADGVTSTAIRYFEVNPGEVYEFGGDAETDGVCTARIVAGVYDKDKLNPTWHVKTTTSASWTSLDEKITIPSGGKFIVLYVQAYSADGWAGFDNLYLRKIDSLSADWGSASDITKIDGGKIYTDSITATQLIKTAALITQSAQIDTGVIDTAHIQDAAIETAKIKDANITTLKVAGNAITIPESSYTAGEAYLGASAWRDIQTLSTTWEGGKVIIMACFKMDTSDETQFYFEWRITRGSTVLWSVHVDSVYDDIYGGYSIKEIFNCTFMDSPPDTAPASYTYKIQGWANTIFHVQARSLVKMEARR